MQDAGSSPEGDADIPAAGVRAAPPFHERAALASAHESALRPCSSLHPSARILPCLK